MARLRLSRRAESDLAAIAAWTIRNFGAVQARLYRDRLFEAFDTISSHPNIGSDQSRIHAGTRRLVAGAHVIYYTRRNDEVVVLRILSVRQDPGRHL